MSEKGLKGRVMLGSIMVLLLVTGIWVIAAPSFNTYVQEGGMVSEAAFILWVDGSDYYCRDGLTGAVTTDTNATTLIQYAIDNANTVGEGKILIKRGIYYISWTITLKSYISLVGESTQTQLGWIGGAVPFIEIPLGATNIHIESLSINDDSIAPQATYGIKIEGDAMNPIQYVVVRDIIMNPAADDRGISAKYVDDGVFENIVTSSGMGASLDEYGVYIANSTQIILNNIVNSGGVYGVFIGDSKRVIMNGGSLNGSGTAELYVDTCESVSIQGVKIEHGADWVQTVILDGSGIVFQGNHLSSAKNGTVVNAGSSGVVIQGNHFYDLGGYDVVVKATANNVLISHNTLSRNLIDDSGTKTKITGNYNYVTENWGTSSIPNASTSIAIAHGLSYTPTAKDFTITFTENPTNTPGACWIDTIGAANFTVNVENDPGASNLDFTWTVRRTP